jgi:hypothetical protein
MPFFRGIYIAATSRAWLRPTSTASQSSAPHTTAHTVDTKISRNGAPSFEKFLSTFQKSSVEHVLSAEPSHCELVGTHGTEELMDDLKVELEKRAKSYQQMLQDEGYGAKNPEWDEKENTWDIRVKHEGVPMLIMLDLDDPDFVRIVLPNFCDVKPDQLESALVALDLANKKCKGTTVSLNVARNDSMVTVEFLDRGTGMDAKILTRYLGMAVNAAKVYIENFLEQAAQT